MSDRSDIKEFLRKQREEIEEHRKLDRQADYLALAPIFFDDTANMLLDAMQKRLAAYENLCRRIQDRGELIPSVKEPLWHELDMLLDGECSCYKAGVCREHCLPMCGEEEKTDEQ